MADLFARGVSGGRGRFFELARGRVSPLLFEGAAASGTVSIVVPVRLGAARLARKGHSS